MPWAASMSSASSPSPTPGAARRAIKAENWPGRNGGKRRALAQRLASLSAVESLSSLMIAMLTPWPVSPDLVAPYARRSCCGRYPQAPGQQPP